MRKAKVTCRDLAPPPAATRCVKSHRGESEPRRKHFSVVFLNLINLTAVICIVSLIADIARTNDNTNNTLSLSETELTRAETTVSTDLNESRITADLKPLESDIITNEHSDEWEIVQMRVTAYCPCEQCCGQYSDGVTACGYKIQPGDTFVAADRRYSFGTEMLIPSYSNGRAVKVLDRGGAIKGNRLDVFFATHQEALEWGVKYLEVSVRWKNL